MMHQLLLFRLRHIHSCAAAPSLPRQVHSGGLFSAQKGAAMLRIRLLSLTLFVLGAHSACSDTPVHNFVITSISTRKPPGLRAIACHHSSGRCSPAVHRHGTQGYIARFTKTANRNTKGEGSSNFIRLLSLTLFVLGAHSACSDTPVHNFVITSISRQHHATLAGPRKRGAV
jgi:hypothetical protein